MFFTTLLLISQLTVQPFPIGQGTISPYFMASDWRAPLRIWIPVRKDWALIIAKHTRNMIDEKWADDLTSRDLDHGHMLMKPDWECAEPCTPDAVMDGVAAFLYHTAENAGRWAGEAEDGVDVDERTPRSVIGWFDGTVQPAVELVWEQRYQLQTYVSHGTVFDTDLWRYRSEQFSKADEFQVTFAMDEGTLTCNLSSQIRIVQDSHGRMILKGGRPFDAFMECYDPRGVLGP